MLFRSKNCIYLEGIREGISNGEDFDSVLTACPYQKRCIASCPTTEEELLRLEEESAESLKMAQKWWIWNNNFNSSNNNLF